MEFRRQLGKANLTAKEFAELVGLNPNSITNYAKKGGIPSHLAIIAALMGTMADNHLDFRTLLGNLGIAANKRHGTGFKGAKQLKLSNNQMDI